MNTRSRLTGAQAIIATLRAYHVETVFGIPGVHTLSLYDVIYTQGGPRHILARHEQGAGFMAEGYARVTGKPGVVLTITGPGVTNVATPVASAYADSIPLLVISTSLPATSSGSGKLHNLKNQLGVMEALADWARAVEYVEEIPEALHDAFRVMRTGRPRGAYLQIPLDLLETTADVEISVPKAERPQPPTEEAIMAAAHLLREAHRPFIVAGAGVTASGANGYLQRLAELLQAPVLMGSKSHDVIASNHPLAITSTGYISPELHTLVEQCDVALVVGSKLGAGRTGDGRLPLPNKLIQIDIDPHEIGCAYPVAVSVVGDARAALEALLEALRDLPDGSPSSVSALADVRESLRRRTQQAYGEAVTLLDGVREGAPREAIIVADMTLLGYAAAQCLPIYAPRTFIHPSELCTIGCGLPLAIGAKVAAPERPVVALCGDGGFLLNASELATAVQEKIPVVVVIFNDNTYAAVKNSQQRRFNRRYIATDLLAPDYPALARAFHATAMRAEGLEELRDAIRTAIENAEPTVIEAPLPSRQW